MKIDITYPQIKKTQIRRQDILARAKWLFILSALAVTIVNIATGPPAWCLIGIWALWMIWSFFLAPALIEHNRISLWIRFISCSSIMLFIIDALSTSGWSLFVVPIVCFGGLAISGILFFGDLERQKQNMTPILNLIAISLLFSAVGLTFINKEVRWPLLVLGAVSLIMLAICFAVMKNGFAGEIKKRIHTR